MLYHRIFTCILAFAGIVMPLEGTGQANNLGLPPVSNFTKSDYGAGTQSWDIRQAADKRVFIANNEGLLCFNGAFWQLFPLPNRTCVRSVHVASNDTIYAGGQGELGYFSPDETAALQFHSLTELVPAQDQNFADVWDVVAFQSRMFFRTSSRIFMLTNGTMHSYPSQGSWEYLARVHGKLYAHDSKRGLLRFNGSEFEQIPGAKPPSVVTGMLPWSGDSILIATLKDGFFSLTNNRWSTWETPIDTFFKNKRIYCIDKLEGKGLAIGTTLGGLVLLDHTRKPQLWMHKGNGLQHRNILSVCADAAGNVWLGLDNGIDYVELTAPLYSIIPDKDVEGAGYIARVWKDTLYLGTSNGLYFIPWKTYYNPLKANQFRLVRGSVGQVWGLQDVAGDLLMGHHEGAFKILGGQAIPINQDAGTWKYVLLNDTTLLAGRYTGVALFKKKNTTWDYVKDIPGLEESCRVLSLEGDSLLWVSHPYRGIYKIDVKNDYKFHLLGQNAGLYSDLFNYVFRINNQAVFASEKGTFLFEHQAGSFIPFTELNTILGADKRINYLQEDKRGNIWFTREGETGVLWIKDQRLKKNIELQVFPQLQGHMVGGFEYLYPASENTLFFGMDRGFFMLSSERLNQVKKAPIVLINQVSLSAYPDSMLYGGFGYVQDAPRLSHTTTGMHISYSSPEIGSGSKLEYSTRISGLDDHWSAWSGATSRELSQLQPGTYKFQVKCRDEHGTESPVASFEWVIRAPWYANSLAYTFYLLLLGGLIVGVVKRQQTLFEIEKAQLSQTHQLKEKEHIQRQEETRQKLNQVQTEKLEAEIMHKNQELALATMHLVQKGEMIGSIREALERIKGMGGLPDPVRTEIKKVLRLVQADVQTDEDWQQFALHFDQVHGDFLKRLRQKYPQLSPNDYRLCAYLRMNLTSKEIAHLLNLSVRGVEGSRYRLRKKMDIEKDENLIDFLMEV
ncbi:MAG: triple tyrosine motif-containing protein [Saprospiraceae bacterium]